VVAVAAEVVAVADSSVVPAPCRSVSDGLDSDLADDSRVSEKLLVLGLSDGRDFVLVGQWDFDLDQRDSDGLGYRDCDPDYPDCGRDCGRDYLGYGPDCPDCGLDCDQDCPDCDQDCPDCDQDCPGYGRDCLDCGRDCPDCDRDCPDYEFGDRGCDQDCGWDYLDCGVSDPDCDARDFGTCALDCGSDDPDFGDAGT